MNTNRSSNKSRQRGQILLIAVMLLALTMTIVLSVTFTSKTETQITKLEEESQKALAAAEAGIEAALKSGDVTIGEGGILQGSGFTGEAKVTTDVGDQFVTPLLQKDEQYTFYLSDYPALGNPYTGDLTVSYGSGGTACNTIALEFSLIYDDPGATGYQIKRFIADLGNTFSSDTGEKGSVTGTKIREVNFNCSAPLGAISAFPNAKVLIVRVFSGATRLGFSSGNQNVFLKPQGKFVNSQATSQTGASKKVELFQSYPQIPADFFVTGF